MVKHSSNKSKIKGSILATRTGREKRAKQGTMSFHGIHVHGMLVHGMSLDGILVHVNDTFSTCSWNDMVHGMFQWWLAFG